MIIDRADFAEDGRIRAVIDGKTLWVPDDPEHPFRRHLAAWEAAGNVIAAHDTATDATPAPVTARQLRLELSSLRLLDGVDSAIDTLPEADRLTARIEWEYATVFDRTHPLIARIGGVLGLSTAEIDALFHRAGAR